MVDYTILTLGLLIYKKVLQLTKHGDTYIGDIQEMRLSSNGKWKMMIEQWMEWFVPHFQTPLPGLKTRKFWISSEVARGNHCENRRGQ